MIPNEVREEHLAICEKCKMRKQIAKIADMHFDWLDCPYDCENDYEHWEKENKMKDTIYRDDAIKCCRNEWEEEVEEQLRLLPSAEAEIIRCKDCKHRSKSGLCHMWSVYGTVRTDDDMYCSYGERGEEE